MKPASSGRRKTAMELRREAKLRRLSGAANRSRATASSTGFGNSESEASRDASRSAFAKGPATSTDGTTELSARRASMKFAAQPSQQENKNISFKSALTKNDAAAALSQSGEVAASNAAAEAANSTDTSNPFEMIADSQPADRRLTLLEGFLNQSKAGGEDGGEPARKKHKGPLGGAKPLATRSKASRHKYLQGEEGPITSPDVPTDWMLKSQAAFTSRAPFDWCDRITPLHQSQAMQENIQTITALGKVKKEVALWRCLQLYRFPRAPLDKETLSELELAFFKRPSSAPKGLSAKRGEHESWMRVFEERQEAWGQAFRSLYYNLVYGACDRFYVLASWCYCVFAAGSEEDGEPCAVLTGANRAWRDDMRAAGVEFTTPLYCPTQPEGKGKKKGAALEEDRLEAERLRGIMNVAKKNPKPERGAFGAAVLVVSGRHAVHCLYDFMLNHEQPRQFSDVPLLLSPRPFLNAAYATPKLALSTRQTQGKIQHRIEITGEIPPCTVIKLCRLFEKTQGAEFDVKCMNNSICAGAGCVAAPQLAADVGGEACRPLAGWEGAERSAPPEELARGLGHLKYSADVYWVGLHT